jgi:hypothetical protein
MRNLLITIVSVTMFIAVLAGFTLSGYFTIHQSEESGELERGFTRELIPSNPDIDVLQHSIAAKDQVARGWIDGKITLPQAADQFRTINASRPSRLSAFLDSYPGNSEQERLCHQVFMYAKTILERRSETKAELARLESELQTYLAKIGSTHPSVPIFPAPVPPKN